MNRRRDLFFLCLFGLLVAVVAATGIGVRATYGAQTTADEPQYLLSALSIWEDGDLNIADELAAERFREFHEVDLPVQTLVLEDGRRISPHDPLLPLLLAVPTGLLGWVGAKAALAGFAGVLAALTVWAACRRFGVAPLCAYVTVGLFAFAPPLAMYSTQVYPELVAALLLLAGFAAVTGPLDRGGQMVLVLTVVALPWLAIKYVPLAAVLAIAGLARLEVRQRNLLLAVFSVAAVAYVGGHLAIYEGLTAYSTGDHFVGGEFTVVGTEVNLWGRSTRLLGLLVDRGFGLAAWQPVFLMLPVVAGWTVTRRRERGKSVALWLMVTGWLMAAFVALTMHGWWFPGRQLVVVLPIIVLLVAAWADETRFRLAVVAFLGSLGVLAFGFLVAEGLRGSLTWVVDFAATANPVYRGLSIGLPDYMTDDSVTWILHGIWLVGAGFLGWLGWRSGHRWLQASVDSGFTNNETNLERVLT